MFRNFVKRYFWVILIIILIVLFFLFFNSSSLNSNKEKKIDLYYFEEIIDKELSILFRISDGKYYKTIDDVTNYDKMFLAFKVLDSYFDDTPDYTVDDVKGVFDSTCFANFDLKMENFDNYKFNSNDNIFIYNGTAPKRYQNYAVSVAKKVINFKKDNNKYLLDVSFLFANNSSSFDNGGNAYGSLGDLISSKNYLVKLSDVKNNDISNYFLDNYNKFKGYLDVYHFVFYVKNKKIYIENLNIN